MSEDHGPSPEEMYRAMNADWLDAIEAGINPYTGRKMSRETTDETTDIVETIRDRRDRAIDAHGRTAAAMDAMHLSPFEQAVYVDAALNTIDRLTAERDAARAEVERLRAACEPIASSLEANLGYATGKPYFWDGPEGREIVQHTLRNAANNLRAALESEVDHD